MNMIHGTTPHHINGVTTSKHPNSLLHQLSCVDQVSSCVAFDPVLIPCCVSLSLTSEKIILCSFFSY